MKLQIARTGLAGLFAVALIMSMAAPAHAGGPCSLARSAGHWSLTDNGTVVGIGPRTAVGVFTLDGNGNLLNGVAASSLNGSVASVGASCDANFNCGVFLWENGVMTDLSSLIPADSQLTLTWGSGIKDRGEIAGSAYDSSTGVSPAFLAIPCDNEHADDEGCQTASQASVGVARPKAVLPENVRDQLRRFGMRMSRTH